MSDTEDTEEFIVNVSKKKQLIEGNDNTQEEQMIISTIEIISDLFINICEENKIKKKNKNFLIKSFTNKFIPSITIKDYILRLAKHSKVNESTIIITLIYIDRICNINHLSLTYYNIHKLILASFILAIKYNEENYYSMSYYSKIGGISLSELNNLEFECLILIRYNLFIQPKLFDKYYKDLMSLKNDDDEYENEEYEDAEEEEEKEIEKDKINNNIINSEEKDILGNENNYDYNNMEKKAIRV
jgi:hypothetical protein